jgi:putative spermidine/putrescine transport system substrate-binding protein
MADRGLPIGFVRPIEGSIGDADTVSLVAGSRHPKEAQELINYMIAPFAQLGMAKLLPTGPTNTLLSAIVDADTEWSRKAPATAQAIRSLYLPDWPTFNKGLKKATDYWNRKIQ